MKTNVIPREVPKMSSVEIAELTDKQHKNVMRDIRNLEEELDGLKFELISYFDDLNREKPMYFLDEDQTMTLVTGYDAKLRYKVVKRWRELETKPMSQLDLMAQSVQILQEQERRLVEHDQKFDQIEKKFEALDGTDGRRTALAWSKMRQVNVNTNRLGRIAARLCRQRDIEITYIYSQQFHKVNCYPIEVLDDAYYNHYEDTA